MEGIPTSGGSHGIPLMTKLIEDLTLAGADKAAIAEHAHTGGRGGAVGWCVRWRQARGEQGGKERRELSATERERDNGEGEGED